MNAARRTSGDGRDQGKQPVRRRAGRYAADGMLQDGFAGQLAAIQAVHHGIEHVRHDHLHAAGTEKAKKQRN